MDVRFINPFVQSVGELFGTMLHLPFALAKPYILDRTRDLSRVFDVAVVIQLDGGAAGIVALRFPKILALALAGALACEEMKSLNADAMDALGEVVNMVVGGAKKNMPGDLIRISTPSVLCSQTPAYPRGIPGVVLPFETGGGRMLLEAVFKSTPPKSGAKPASPEGLSAEGKALLDTVAA